MKKILVVGQGYVGAPLALAAAQARYRVTGYDKSPEVIETLKAGLSDALQMDRTEFTQELKSGRLQYCSILPAQEKFDVIVICVPTPLTDNALPDLSYLNSAIQEVFPLVTTDNLLVIESTVATGTVRDHILTQISKKSMISKSELNIAFSPERIDPSNKNWGLKNTPKLLAALNLRSLSLAKDFYSSFIDHLVVCNSVEVAETAKLLENTFRLVNISLVNEIANYCEKLKIDVHDVIKAASSKPYGFMAFYPSLGAGGHCIPVDPIYLLDKARSIGSPLRLAEIAVEVNSTRPEYFVAKANKILHGLAGKKILLVGVAYKPNVSDVRETPVEKLLRALESQGAIVSWHDDLVREWHGQTSTQLSPNFDLAILCTPHDYLDLQPLEKTLILNTRHSF
jgi:UDP-N-acetyl-D-glucosamine dehydrogenase